MIFSSPRLSSDEDRCLVSPPEWAVRRRLLALGRQQMCMGTLTWLFRAKKMRYRKAPQTFGSSVSQCRVDVQGTKTADSDNPSNSSHITKSGRLLLTPSSPYHLPPQRPRSNATCPFPPDCHSSNHPTTMPTNLKSQRLATTTTITG